MATEGYKEHRAGSAKGKCHKVWDETKGDVSEKRAAVIKKAVALGKTEGTGSSWASEWNGGGAAKKTTKKAKKAVKRERPAKAAKAKGGKKAKPAVKREKLPAEARA